jgi:hypothetical protein
VEKYGTARHAPACNIIQLIHFTCCITKATDMHSEYAILIAFAQQQWLREHASMLTLHIACVFCNTGCQLHPEALPQYFFASHFNSHATYTGPVLRAHCTFCSMFRCCVDPIKSRAGKRKIASQNSYVMYVLIIYVICICRYCTVAFTKNPEKYIKYNPTQVSALIDRFFDVAA